MDDAFWSDDFDMDLPKVIPDAKTRLGKHADLELVTTCTRPTHGRLNHPCAWNHPLGLVSFVGRGHTHRPGHYHTSAPTIRCTLWEVIRDAWPHSNVVLFEGFPIWHDQWEHFQPIMYHIRKLHELTAGDLDRHIAAVRHEIDCCRMDVARLVGSRETQPEQP